MKKEIVLFFVIGSMSTMNVAMHDDGLVRSKKDSPIPSKQHRFCCRPGAAVPLCDRCFENGLAASILVIEKKFSDESKSVTSSQKVRQCP